MTDDRAHMEDLVRRYGALPDDLKGLASEIAALCLEARKYALTEAKKVVAEVRVRYVVPTSGVADAACCCDEIKAGIEALEAQC